MKSWTVAWPPFAAQGFTFSTTRGVRYVVRHDLAGSRSGRAFSGTHTTYRWTGRTWATVATKKSGILTAKAAQRYSGFHGLVWR